MNRRDQEICEIPSGLIAVNRYLSPGAAMVNNPLEKSRVCLPTSQYIDPQQRRTKSHDILRRVYLEVKSLRVDFVLVVVRLFLGRVSIRQTLCTTLLL